MNIVLNYDMYEIDYAKFYLPVLMIDVRPYEIQCDMHNSIMFFVEHPRTSIDLLSGFFEFYYEASPSAHTHGQVISKTLVTYHLTLATGNDHVIYEYTPCILFTRGMNLEEILIYMPKQEMVFLRELRYRFWPRAENICSLCCEPRSDIINLHKNEYHHECCIRCIMRWGFTCPFCRIPIE